MSSSSSGLSFQVSQEIARVKQMYLSRVPIPVISELIENFIGKHEITFDLQDLILNETINSQIGLTRPASLKYRLAFCKRLVNILEDHHIEIADNFYTNYTNLLKLKTTQNFSYTTFIVRGNEITIRDTDNLVQDGTTGLFSWEAGKEFILYSLENESHFKDKVILELGSGTGLTGVAICQLIKPRKYYLTDCSPKVLSNLKATLEENNISIGEVITFDWEREEDKDSLDTIKPDLIIGCDLVYDPSNLTDLIEVIQKSNQLSIPMIFLFTDRKTHVLDQFEEKLDQLKHLNWSKKVRMKKEDSFYYSSIPNLTFHLYSMRNSSTNHINESDNP